MSLTQQMAKHFRDVYFGGNWTYSNLKDNLKEITWQQATTKIADFNTIAALVFHMNYYVSGVLKALQGGPLETKDKYSFDHPPIESEESWNKLLEKTWDDAQNFAKHIEQFPEDKLWETFINDDYGNYYRNFHGIIEHNHYHLGQIALLRKMLLAGKNDSNISIV